MSRDLYRNALPAGFKLHWYSVERVLGQGGFGTTYLARDNNLEQPVALKEYLPSEIVVRGKDQSVQPRSEGDAEQFKWGLERFLVEGRTLARFDHPNIIQVLSIFEANHTAYLVMRYEQGESLRTILKQRKQLSEEELLGVALPILDGLAKVHAEGFIHRDIQPSNIYIRDDGSPVLLDFGAARKTMGGPRTLTILVAPGYAPIEQYYSSSAEQGPWTDIYGMGATLYRAVAGVAPIDAIERSRGMLGSTRDLLVPAKVVGQGRYSDAFLAAIDHALMFSEKERPATVMEWAAELRGQAAAPPPKIPVRPAAPAARRPIPDKPARKIASEGITAISVTPGHRAPPVFWWSAAAALILLAVGGVWLMRESPVVDVTTAQTAAQPPAAKAARPIDVEFDPAALLQEQVADPQGIAPEAMDAGSPGSLVVEGKQAAAGPAATESPPAAGPTTASSSPSATPQSSQPLPEPAAKPAEDAKRESAQLAALQAELRALKAEQEAERRRARQLEEERARKAAASPEPKPEATARREKPPPPQPDPMQTALDALAAQDFSAAFNQLKPLASAGNPVAQYHLAGLYRSGQGVLANNAAALEWMRKAAQQGDRNAQVALARMFAEGVDGVYDYFLAYTWFLVAERNGVFTVLSERNEVESRLQPEQLPQASALAAALQKAQAAGPAAGIR